MAGMLGFESVTLLSGVGFMAAGMTGGGWTIKIKDKEIDVPKLCTFSKILCSIFGFLLIFIPVTATFFSIDLQAFAPKSSASEVEIIEEVIEDGSPNPIGSHLTVLSSPLYAASQKIKLKRQIVTLSEHEKVIVKILSPTATIYARKIPSSGPPTIILNIKGDRPFQIPIVESKSGYSADIYKLNTILKSFGIIIHRFEMNKIISVVDNVNSVKIIIYRKVE